MPAADAEFLVWTLSHKWKNHIMIHLLITNDYLNIFTTPNVVDKYVAILPYLCESPRHGP